jgi:hypothetical protein
MKTRAIRFLAIAALIVPAMCGTARAASRTWDFTNSADYAVSDPTKIEVAGGTARLILQSDLVNVGSLAGYFATNAAWSDVSFGPDVLLTLSKTTNYASQGEFISRIFDGGLGNRWDSFRYVAYNAQLLNAGGELPASTAGLVLLARMNNDWRDMISGNFGVPSGSPVFSSQARLGSHSGYFGTGGFNDHVSYVKPYSFSQAMTVSFWYRTVDVAQSALAFVVVFVKAGTYVGSIDVGGGSLSTWRPNNIDVNMTGMGSSFSQTEDGTVTASDNGRWMHIAVVYDNTKPTGKMRIFKDGAVLPMRLEGISGSVAPIDDIRIGARGAGGQGVKGWIDEVAVFNTALTDGQVYDLSRRPQSLVFQCRSGSTNEELLSKQFVGPDGTPDSYYSEVDPNLVNSAVFSRVDRLLQYRAVLLGQGDGLETPFVDSVGILGTRASAFDNTLGDFQRGQSINNVTIYPETIERSGVGLARSVFGGYPNAGTFTSRTLDAGTSVFWDRLNWDSAKEMAADSSVLALWHLNGGLADGTGRGFNGQNPQNLVFTSNAKLGTQSAVFNGKTSQFTVDIHQPSSNQVGAVSFWINSLGRDGGVMDFGGGRTIEVQSRLIKAGRSGGSAPLVYVNGSVNSRLLLPGWNHVAVVYPSTFWADQQLVIGRSGASFFEGLLDELAVFSKAIDGGKVKSGYVYGGGGSAGLVRFQVRASSTFPIPDAVPFIGPGNLPSAYFTASGASLPSEVWNKRYFQYRMYLQGDETASPLVYSVSIDYSGAAAGTETDAAPGDFALGAMDGAVFVGADLAPYDISVVPGLVNIESVNEVSLEGLWHMDESAWAAGSSVLDSSGNNRHGDPQGGPNPSSDARVGSACGLFSGASQYLILPSITLGGDFTVGGWFRTANSTRTAIASRSDGSFFLEINGDGTAGVPGSAAFVVKKGTRHVVVSPVTNLNDGGWHHLAGVRKGRGFHLYVDGVSVASALLPSSFGAIGLGQHEVARHPETGGFINGSVDELFIYSRALSDADMTRMIASGRAVGGEVAYQSTVFDARGPAIWEAMSWVENGTYGEAHPDADPHMVAVWHMDSVNGGTLVDSSANSLNGALFGSYSVGTGVFSQAVALAGAGMATIPYSALLEPENVSVSVWVNMADVESRAIADRRLGGTGYALYTDSNGLPVFMAGGIECKSPIGIPIGDWTQLAGTYDGSAQRLFMNGRLVASVSNSFASLAGNDLLVGQSALGPQPFVGRIDELVIWNKALNQEEAVDLARSGRGYIRFQARAGDTPVLDGVPFVGADGTSNSYFTIASESPMMSAVPLGQYFQFRATLAGQDGLLAPVLQGVSIKQSAYPADKPWVMPGAGKGLTFLGNMLGFGQTMATNDDDRVRYQISGDDGANWYHWSAGAWRKYDPLDGEAWAFANEWLTVSNNISSFYKQLYDKTGGVYRFKAFLRSDGDDQVALDSVRTDYSIGRLTVLEPNGAETNNAAWLVDSPYTVRWSSGGTVSGNLRVEYSRDGGVGWNLITNGIGNVGSVVWHTPPAGSMEMLVRISDNNDSSIHDQSDSMFHLTDSYQVRAPNGGEVWYMTETNSIVWRSPGPAAARGPQVDIRYSYDGVDYSLLVARGATNVQGSSSNVFQWAVEPGTPPMPIPSTNGRIRVHAYDNTNPLFNGQDDSDRPFTLAGITITAPAQGSFYNNGTDIPVTWVSQLAGAQVGIDFSRDGGGTWTNVLPIVANVNGTNTYTWPVNELPSDTARLRIRSLSNGRIYGISGLFQLADVRVTSPASGADWELRTQKMITWESGGAGNSVDLFYSYDDGAAWTKIASNVFNGASNGYLWTVAPYPSATARIKVVSALDPANLFDVSPRFNMAGVRVTYPDAGAIWPKGATDAIKWEFAQAGSQAGIYTTLDGGTNWTLVGNRGLGNRSINWQPTQPTARALARITSLDPPAWATGVGMTDDSDGFFTIGGVVVTGPTNGQLFTVQTTNQISWTSAGSADSGGGEYARIYYTTTGGATSNFIAEVGNNEIYPGINVFQWNIPDTVSPSLNARIIVVAGPFSGMSPVFTLRGMRMLNPTDTAVWDIGSTQIISWNHAGLDVDATGYIFLSLDGGVSFDTEAINTLPIYVSAGQYTWAIPSNSTPSTAAVLKFVVQNSPKIEDINYEVKTRQFILRGLKIKEPGEGDVWPHGSSNLIHLVASRAGEFANFYYASDGATFDTAPGREVRKNWALSDGNSYVPWTVEYWRLPSTNARLRAVSTISTTVSEPFSVHGIKVNRPISTSIWAAGETNTVTWTAVGTSGSFDVFVEKPGGPTIQVGDDVTGSSLDWLVDPSVVGTGVIVRVRDSTGALEGTSEPFLIVSEPTVIVVNPAQSNLWRVTDTYSVTWSKGGAMSNYFRVAYSPSPYASQIDIFTGAAAYDPENNSYSIPWTVPDRLGPAKIIVENLDKPIIADESDIFYIVGKFQLIFPNGGETNIFALKPTTVRWFTWGSAASVNLFYSIDPLHADDSWHPVNSTPISVTGYGTEPSSYLWSPVDLGTSIGSVRLRVEQSNQPGALDESDGDFSILYYTIVWNVLDQETLQHLNNLTLTESNGSSQSGLTSPVTRRYPYNYFDSVWSRAYFFNYVDFNWLSEPSRTKTIVMRRSNVEAEYNVMANITYDGGSNDTLTIYAWLDRGGRVMLDPSKCTVHIYDKPGNEVKSLVSTNTQPDTGVFAFNWDNVTDTLTEGETYYARVDIDYSGETYWSVISYTLRIAADQLSIDEVKAAIANAETNITGQVSGVSNIVQDLATAQGLFRNRVTNSLDRLEFGTSNLLVSVTNFVVDATNRLAALAADVDIIRPAVTNIRDRLTPIEDNLIATLARILTRPDSVSYGSTNTILYKTRIGATNVRIAVAGTLPPVDMPMTEVINGIYEAILVADWGTNSYRVTCSDDKAMDSIVLNVVGAGLYDMPRMLGNMSLELAKVSSNVTDMALILDGIEGIGELAGIATNLNPLIDALQAVPWNALSNVSDVAKYIPDIYDVVTNTDYVLSSIQNITNITSLSDQITNLQAIVANMSGLSDLQTNVAKLVSSMGGVDLSTLGADMSNVVKAVQDLGSLDTVKDQITNLVAIVDQLGDLQTLETNVASLVSTMGGVNLGAFGTQMSNVVAAIQGLGPLGDVQAQVSNLVSVINNMQDLGELQTNVADLVDSMKGVNLADFGSRMTNLTSAINSMGDLSDVQAQITNLVAVVDGLDELASLQTNVAVLAGVMGGVNLQTFGTQMTNLLDAIDSMGQLSDIQTQITNLAAVVQSMDELATLKTNVSLLVASMGGVDLSLFGKQMTNLTSAIESMGDLSTIQDQITNLVSVVDGLDELGALQTNVTTLVSSLGSVNLAVLGTEVSNLTTTIKNMQDLSTMEQQITNLVAVVKGLEDLGTLQTNVSSLVDSMGGVDLAQLGQRMTNLVSAIGGLGDIEKLQAQITNMVAMLEGVGGLEALGTNVLALTDAISGSDLGEISERVSNTWVKVQTLGDLTGLETEIAALSASLGGANLAQMGTNVTTVLALVQSLGGISGLSTNIEALSRGLAGVDMAAMSGSVLDTLNRVLGLESGMARLQTSLGSASLSGVDLSAVGRMEAMLGQQGSLDRNTFFGRINALSAQIDSLGSASADAAKNAQSAKTQAASAASGIESLKNMLQGATVDPDKVMGLLNEINNSMAAAQAGINEIPKSFDISSIEKAMENVVRRLRQLMTGEQLGQVPIMIETGGAEAVAVAPTVAEETQPVTEPGGEGVSKETIARLGRNMEEIDSSVQLIKRLMEEKFQTPVVEVRLQGVQ